MSVLALDHSLGRFHEPDQSYLSARRVAEVLGVTLSELAQLCGVARNTLAAAAGRKIDAALSPLVRILAMASEMTGNEARAAIWFKHQPIPGFAGKTGYDLVLDKTPGVVIDYLESVRAGVYA
jgi:uncharacterized protein (DUF2384 family)